MPARDPLPATRLRPVSIRTALLTAMAVMVAAQALALSLALTWLGSREVTVRAAAELDEQAQRVGEALQLLLGRRLSGLSVLAHSDMLVEGTHAAARTSALLREVLSYTPEFTSLALVDAGGRPRVVAGATSLQATWQDEAWFQAALRGPVALLNAPGDGHAAGAPHGARVAVPVHAADGRVVAVLTGTFGERLLALLSRPGAGRSSADAAVIWLDDAARVLYASDAALHVGQPLPPAPDQIEGRAHFGALPALLAPRQVTVVLRRPRADALADVRLLQRRFALVSAVALALGVAVAVRLSARLTRPVQRFTAAVASAAQGGPAPAEALAGGGYRDIQALGRALRTFMDSASQAQAAVRRREQELAALSRQLISTQWSERRLLSQRLHDQIGTDLSSAKLALEVALARSAAAPADAAAARHWQRLVPEVLDDINRVVACVRATLNEMRPPMLIDFGLDAALAWEVERRGAASAARLHYRAPAQPRRFDAAREYAAFVLAREALGNALAHARARRITVSLAQHATGGQLRVADDGIGFDPAMPHAGHLGVVGMRERAAAAGMTLTLFSAPAQGTQVVVAWQDEAAPAQDAPPEPAAQAAVAEGRA